MKIAVEMMTTINVAIARHTASLSVNFQIAKMQSTVQATSENVMTINDKTLTARGFTTPRGAGLLKFGLVTTFSLTELVSFCKIVCLQNFLMRKLDYATKQSFKQHSSFTIESCLTPHFVQLTLKRE